MNFRRRIRHPPRPQTVRKRKEPKKEYPRISYHTRLKKNSIKNKKLERLVADCEAAIEQTESAIAILEEKMATPDGASDMSLYEQHQKLKQQLDHTVEEWERVSMELEEMNEK